MDLVRHLLITWHMPVLKTRRSWVYSSVVEDLSSMFEALVQTTAT